MSTQTPPPFYTRKLRNSVRKVLRANGVPSRDLEDLFQDVMREAVKSGNNLPSREPERTQYMHGIARNRAKRYVRDKLQQPPMVPLDAVASTPADDGPSYETVDLAQKLVAEGKRRDPQGTDWLLRDKVYDEPATEIAAQDGVPVDRVRKRIERLTRYLRDYASTIAMVFLVVCAGFALHGRGETSQTGGQTGGHATQPEETVPDATEQARALRSSALRECAAQAWDDCLRDLDAAGDLDPEGDKAPEVQSARELANSKVRGLSRERKSN
jgi:DNA-directed RNA polymerase specialized sigma24 family protein